MFLFISITRRIFEQESGIGCLQQVPPIFVCFITILLQYNLLKNPSRAVASNLNSVALLTLNIHLTDHSI